jgi:hypothetical protein
MYHGTKNKATPARFTPASAQFTPTPTRLAPTPCSDAFATAFIAHGFFYSPGTWISSHERGGRYTGYAGTFEQTVRQPAGRVG